MHVPSMEIDIQARRIHVINVRWFLWTLVIPVLIKVVKNGPGYLKSLVLWSFVQIGSESPSAVFGFGGLNKKKS